MTTIRIGIDVGGTFTDFAMVRMQAGERAAITTHKVPSTPGDPSQAVETGLRDLIGQGLDVAAITSITHGTTLALNAIIQRAGAKVALVTSRGHKDILEIARSRMPKSFDLHAVKERPLVPRGNVVEIDARLDRHGRPVSTPSDAQLGEVIDRLRDIAPDAVAVNIIGAYADPAFEIDIARKIEAALGCTPVTSAAATWPEIREYERSVVAVLGAHIQPLMQNYFRRLNSDISGLGISAPLYISASNGGSLSLQAAIERPLDTVLSGPASGVTAAVRVAGASDIITFDMGGTSSDIAVVVGGNAQFTTRSVVGDFPLILPVVEVNAIGAGGGSIIWDDYTGTSASLRVGPESAGADPGPASYGRGGERPALTDAYLATGIIEPAHFLGGRMALSGQAAIAAFARLHSRLGWESAPGDGSGVGDGCRAAIADTAGSREATFVAEGALKIATAQMATQLRKNLAQRGATPEDFTLVAFGGAGPTHAAMLAEELGITRILVPASAATFCALGAALSPLRRDYAVTFKDRVTDESMPRLNALVHELGTEAIDWMREHGDTARNSRIELTADMKYVGQAYDLSVSLESLLVGDEREILALDRAGISAMFSQEHERLYGFADHASPIDLATLRLSITGPDPEVQLDSGEDFQAQESSRGQVLWNGQWSSATRISLSGSGSGSGSSSSSGGSGDSQLMVVGPAVIDKTDTTVFVPPGWHCGSDDAGNLVLTRGMGQE